MSRQVPADSCASSAARLRIDKWLWAARFFKTRGLAQAAVEAGRVRFVCAGEPSDRIKSSREVRAGDILRIQVGDLVWTVSVRVLSDQRGPAPVARQLYEESAQSQVERLARIEAAKARVEPSSGIKGRPTKRDRRQIHRFNEI